MADFGKLNFAVSFKPQTAFPLDARYYFSSLSAAEAAAATAVEVGSSDGTYFYGENVCVVTESSADLYIIQPDKTLKPVGSAVLGDGKSIEIVDGKVALKGFGSATAGQQPRINAAGTAIEWYTPDTSTVSGLADTVAGHTQDIQNLQTGKADTVWLNIMHESDKSETRAQTGQQKTPSFWMVKSSLLIQPVVAFVRKLETVQRSILSSPLMMKRC